MAGYGYRTYSGMEPRINDEGWRKPSFDDHVCRPVIIDAEGRKQPIIRYNGSTTPTSHNTPGSNVAKTETYVEHVHSPMDYTINYSSSPSMVVSPPERTSTTKIQLTKPTNEIGTAIEYLKEAATIAKPFLGSNGTGTDAVAPPAITRRPRFTIGVPPSRRSDNATTNSGSTTTTTVETISSSEAKRRYGNAPSLSFTTGEIENYAATIDSREAMKRYNGRIV